MRSLKVAADRIHCLLTRYYQRRIYFLQAALVLPPAHKSEFLFAHHNFSLLHLLQVLFFAGSHNTFRQSESFFGLRSLQHRRKDKSLLSGCPQNRRLPGIYYLNKTAQHCRPAIREDRPAHLFSARDKIFQSP